LRLGLLTLQMYRTSRVGLLCVEFVTASVELAQTVIGFRLYCTTLRYPTCQAIRQFRSASHECWNG